jgi:predicted nuclease of predicted toxin-antitoxin system
VKLPEPFVYFVDRSLGREVIVEALRAAGQEAHAHDAHFAPDTEDAEWLVEVGRRGWVVLTKDKNIRRNELERVAIVQAKVACFMLGSGNMKADDMARLFIDNLRRMERVLRRYRVPLVATLASGGGVRVLIAEGRWLEPPKQVK